MSIEVSTGKAQEEADRIKPALTSIPEKVNQIELLEH